MDPSRVFFLVVSLLAGASSQNLEFMTNAGTGRYQFEYPEQGMNWVDNAISESLPPGQFSVTCLLDGQPSTGIMYSIGGGGGGLFQVNRTTGALSLLEGRELDYETNTNVRFSVTCSHPSTTTSNTAQVGFRVLPINEFEPVRNPPTRFVSIPEDTPVDTVLVSTRQDAGALTTFSAMDEDDGPDGELEYTLAFNENLTSFAVDQFSGTLTVAQILDVDNTPNGFVIETIRLTVCDVKPPIVSCPNIEVSLVITSTNDNDPIFTQDIYRRTGISEDVPSGTLIANVSCTDADRGLGAYDSVRSPSSLFNVTENSGYQLISLNGELDFETSRSHNVTLTCFDSQGVNATATLLVTITPVNDNPPRFTTPIYYFSVNRLLTTGNEIGRVVAVDEDQVVGRDLTYTMTDNENFQIQGDGSILLDDFVYVIEGQNFTMTVGVSDGEFTDSAIVIITVRGVLSVPEIILVCMSALVFLVLVVFIIVCCCYCSVCCTRLIPKQRHVEVEVPIKVFKETADAGLMGAIPVVPMPVPMYDQGKGMPYMMAVPQWSQSVEEEEASEDEVGAELASIGTASSRVYTPTPYLKEMVEMFKDGDEILDGKKSKKK